MRDRRGLLCTLWLGGLLALLACVLAAPTWRPGRVAVSRVSGGLRLPLAHSAECPTTRLNATRAADSVLQENALACEDEEEGRVGALEEPRVTFRTSWSFHKFSDRRTTLPPSTLSPTPLRC